MPPVLHDFSLDRRHFHDLMALGLRVITIYQTLAGFVMTHLGRVPASADIFVWQSLRFEVVDMDGKRIDKVLVTPAQKNLHTE